MYPHKRIHYFVPYLWLKLAYSYLRVIYRLRSTKKSTPKILPQWQVVWFLHFFFSKFIALRLNDDSFWWWLTESFCNFVFNGAIQWNESLPQRRPRPLQPSQGTFHLSRDTLVTPSHLRQLLALFIASIDGGFQWAPPSIPSF